jgi:xylose isomerase
MLVATMKGSGGKPVSGCCGATNLFSIRISMWRCDGCNADVFVCSSSGFQGNKITKSWMGQDMFFGVAARLQDPAQYQHATRTGPLGRFLQMAVDYKTNQFTASSSRGKPKEPTKHQYDSDAATCYSFLQHYQ